MTTNLFNALKGGVSSLCAVLALSSFSSAAIAQDKLELSANVAMTSDYVFRGVSQTQEQFAVQGGFDASYNIFYAGVWASNVDFADASALGDSTDVELDVYLGIKPKWRGYDFDFGAIFYLYPDATDTAGGEYNFTELKAGVSYELIKDRLNMSSTVFYSPDYFGETGPTWTFESTAEVSLPYNLKLSGTLGSLYYEDSAGNDYVYGNVGIYRTFYNDKFKLDMRYWDSDLNNDPACQSGGRDLCDSRAVVTLSASF